ncbi:MAG TPA: chromosome segregation protein SMC [Planctomycetota bacterium]|nr:chromosome segregation protein SMC [Planctomycetota bacterium]
MRLKKLVVQGFKSFADKTEFLFDGGVTCVVGPNGCGKSNVLDAVKWILGEQRPTSLRGKEMIDVIFNGTDRRAPVGMAEGTLVFDNRDRQLPIEEDEVQVTRRIFRSGDGEYFVNRRPVRLKDLRDLFFGTGLAPGGYAFMEQGKIDSVIAGNPVDRRRVFEEAAGISRFRVKKRETELKLEKVAENLTRLRDIIEEVQRQVRSLKVQAGKARNYQEISAELKALQLRFDLHRFREAVAEAASVEARVQAGAGEREALTADRETLRAALDGIDVELRAFSDELGRLRQKASETAAKANGAREKATFHARRREELSARIERRRAEISAREEQAVRFEQDAVVATRERDDLTRDVERLAGESAARRAEAEGARERADALRREDVELADALRALEKRAAAAAGDGARFASEARRLEEEAQRAEEAEKRIAGERQQLRSQLDEKTGLRGARAEAVDARREALARAELSADGLEREASTRAEELRALESELARTASRADVLEAAVAKREGLDEGARAVLGWKEREPGFLPGLRGVLSELIDVDFAEARAVAAALGDAASALVVETAEEALAGVRRLREAKAGGAVFLPLSSFREAPARETPGVRAKSAETAPVVAALLGGLETVDAATFAARAAAGDGGPLLVSVDGEVRRDGRVFTAPRGKGHGGMVVRQAELKQLRRAAKELEAKVAAAREAYAAARQSVERARADVRELSAALVHEQGDAARLDQELVRLGRDLERLAADERREAERRASAATRLAAAQDGAETADRVRREHEAKAAGLEARRRELGDEAAAHASTVRRFAEALEQARIEEVRCAERLQAAGARGRHLAEAAAAARDAAAAAEREIAADEARVAESREAAEAESAIADEASRLLEEERALVRAREESEEEIRGRRDDAAARLRDVEERLDAATEELTRARGRDAELRASVAALLERAREESGVDLREAAGSAPIEADDVDWAAVADEIKQRKERLLRLGAVNLAAVDELKEAEDRAGFLVREEEDLVKSQNGLHDALKNIEKQTTAMFLDAFNVVREHFAVTFRKLFSGGKAELFLEDETRPLECGIEIRARPPGKEVRLLGQLSGGERTMVAVALLFSILRANPTPCALLDEVDAALDEDNTERFSRMLDEFLGSSQFVIVTHSKRTMDKADLLVGVTMPERGVSRRVTVKLTQIGADGALKDVEAVNRAAATETQVVESNDAVADAGGEPSGGGAPSAEASASAAFASEA